MGEMVAVAWHDAHEPAILSHQIDPPALGTAIDAESDSHRNPEPMPSKPASNAVSDSAPQAKAPKASKAKVQLASSLGEVITTRLPRGHSSLPRDVVEKEQRKRLILALAKVVARKGYAAVTLTDITAEAGVSRETFYGLFRDKEDCFLCGYELINSAVMADVAKVSGTATTLIGQMLLGLTAYFQRINVDLPLARAFIGEAQAATPATRAAYEKNYTINKLNFQQWIDAVQQQHPDVQRVSDTEISLVMLGMDGYIMSRIRAGLTFSDEDIAAVHKFTMMGLGMYEVAMKVQQVGGTQDGYGTAHAGNSGEGGEIRRR